jgi:hypothetical protein
MKQGITNFLRQRQSYRAVGFAYDLDCSLLPVNVMPM